MAFELKNSIGELVVKDDFSPQDCEAGELKTEILKFQMPYGTMETSQWFFDGIKMSHSKSVFNEPVILDWKGDTEMITMCFNLQGKISLRDDSMLNAFELAGNQHNMFYGREAEGKMKVEELNMRSFLIQFSKKTFLAIANDGS